MISIILYQAVIRPYNPDFILWAPILEFSLTLIGSIVLGAVTGLIVAYVKFYYEIIPIVLGIEEAIRFRSPDTKRRVHHNVSLSLDYLSSGRRNILS